MSSAPDMRQVRAALFLSIALGVVGVWGVTSSLGELSMQSTRPSAPAPTGVALDDAVMAVAFAYQDIQLGTPFGSAYASMNLVVSIMLVIGSFMVSSRSPNAVWWVRNATVANALYVLIDTVAKGAHLRANIGRLRPLLQAWLDVSARETTSLDDPATIVGLFQIAAALTLIVLFARLGLQWLLYWRIGSEPVRAFLSTAD